MMVLKKLKIYSQCDQTIPILGTCYRDSSLIWIYHGHSMVLPFVFFLILVEIKPLLLFKFPLTTIICEDMLPHLKNMVQKTENGMNDIER